MNLARSAVLRPAQMRAVWGRSESMTLRQLSGVARDLSLRVMEARLWPGSVAAQSACWVGSVWSWTLGTSPRRDMATSCASVLWFLSVMTASHIVRPVPTMRIGPGVAASLCIAC